MYQGELLDSQPPRDKPDGSPSGGYIPKGAKITAITLEGNWLRLATVDGMPRSGWLNAGANMSKIRYWVIVAPPPVDPPPTTVLVPFTLAVDGFKPFSGKLEKL